ATPARCVGCVLPLDERPRDETARAARWRARGGPSFEGFLQVVDRARLREDPTRILGRFHVDFLTCAQAADTTASSPVRWRLHACPHPSPWPWRQPRVGRAFAERRRCAGTRGRARRWPWLQLARRRSGRGPVAAAARSPAT